MQTLVREELKAIVNIHRTCSFNRVCQRDTFFFSLALVFQTQQTPENS